MKITIVSRFVNHTTKITKRFHWKLNIFLSLILIKHLLSYTIGIFLRSYEWSSSFRLNCSRSAKLVDPARGSFRTVACTGKIQRRQKHGYTRAMWSCCAAKDVSSVRLCTLLYDEHNCERGYTKIGWVSFLFDFDLSFEFDLRVTSRMRWSFIIMIMMIDEPLTQSV